MRASELSFERPSLIANRPEANCSCGLVLQPSTYGPAKVPGHQATNIDTQPWTGLDATPLSFQHYLEDTPTCPPAERKVHKWHTLQINSLSFFELRAVFHVY